MTKSRLPSGLITRRRLSLSSMARKVRSLIRRMGRSTVRRASRLRSSRRSEQEIPMRQDFCMALCRDGHWRKVWNSAAPQLASSSRAIAARMRCRRPKQVYDYIERCERGEITALNKTERRTIDNDNNIKKLDRRRMGGCFATSIRAGCIIRQQKRCSRMFLYQRKRMWIRLSVAAQGSFPKLEPDAGSEACARSVQISAAAG